MCVAFVQAWILRKRSAIIKLMIIIININDNTHDKSSNLIFDVAPFKL